MNKILLIPGSFNPITNAHVDMALTAKKAVNADAILFIPAHDTYVAKKKTLIPGYCQYQIVMKIICGHPPLKQPASFHRGHTILLLR